jgi:hypothetical protein
LRCGNVQGFGVGDPFFAESGKSESGYGFVRSLMNPQQARAEIFYLPPSGIRMGNLNPVWLPGMAMLYFSSKCLPGATEAGRAVVMTVS